MMGANALIGCFLENLTFCGSILKSGVFLYGNCLIYINGKTKKPQLCKVGWARIGRLNDGVGVTTAAGNRGKNQ